jgi:hypothetical protein
MRLQIEATVASQVEAVAMILTLKNAAANVFFNGWQV